MKIFNTPSLCHFEIFGTTSEFRNLACLIETGMSEAVLDMKDKSKTLAVIHALRDAADRNEY
jgi:hypothetical protein